MNIKIMEFYVSESFINVFAGERLGPRMEHRWNIFVNMILKISFGPKI